MENSPPRESKYVTFLRRCRTKFGKETGDEDAVLLFLLDSSSEDENVLNYYGLEGQTQFPHAAWERIRTARIKRERTVISQLVEPPDTIKYGMLSDYFKTIKNEPQQWEQEIIESYFDIEKDKYLSIPITKRAVLHIVYKETMEKSFALNQHSLIATSLQNDYNSMN